MLSRIGYQRDPEKDRKTITGIMQQLLSKEFELRPSLDDQIKFARAQYMRINGACLFKLKTGKITAEKAEVKIALARAIITTLTELKEREIKDAN